MGNPSIQQYFYHSTDFKTGLTITARTWSGDFGVAADNIQAIELGDGVYGLSLPLVLGRNGVLVKENGVPKLLVVLYDS